MCLVLWDVDDEASEEGDDESTGYLWLTAGLSLFLVNFEQGPDLIDLRRPLEGIILLVLVLGYFWLIKTR